MSVDSIAYAELYVQDHAETVAYFTSAMDFTPTAAAFAEPGRAARTSTLLTSGSARLVITSPSHPADHVAAHLARHGEGVADIAFGCADVTAAHRRAVAAGATSLFPPSRSGGFARVGGFGCVRHTLVASAAGAMPPGVWTALPSDGERGRVRALDHVAVCLDAGTIRTTADFYDRAFGLERFFSEYIEVGDQAMESVVVRDPAGAVTFTLLQPDTSRAAGQIDAFLTANGGPGVQHLAFLVDDVVASVRSFTGRGTHFLTTPDPYYDRIAEQKAAPEALIEDLRSTHVLIDQDEWGHLLQIFTRSPHRDGGLFYELIQREQARGFGGGNIRALYEAVLRAQPALAESR